MQQRRNQIKKNPKLIHTWSKISKKKTKTKKKLMRRPTQKKNGQADQNTHVLQSSDAKLVAHTLTKKTQTDQKKKVSILCKSVR